MTKKLIYYVNELLLSYKKERRNNNKLLETTERDVSSIGVIKTDISIIEFHSHAGRHSACSSILQELLFLVGIIVTKFQLDACN
jgi:hypothetical protein